MRGNHKTMGLPSISENKHLKTNGTVHRILCYTLATILGNYARQGLEYLTNYEPSYVRPTTVLWANCGGCIMMGLCQDLRELFFYANEYHVLFLSITTGFCGSFSSFSTMIIEMFTYSASLTNENIATGSRLPNRAYGIMEFLSVMIVHLGVSLSGLLLGRKLGKEVLIPYFISRPTKTEVSLTDNEPTEPSDNSGEVIEKTDSYVEPEYYTPRWCVYILFGLDLFLTYMSIPILVMIIILTAFYGNYSRGVWTLPVLFGIPGSFLRYYLSKWFNNRKSLSMFPVGTFIANISATLILSILIMVQRGQKNGQTHERIINNKNTCHIVQALGSGFCGSLSTVSTFINEAHQKDISYILRYYFITIFCAYCLCVITLGSYSWTRGLTLPVC